MTASRTTTSRERTRYTGNLVHWYTASGVGHYIMGTNVRHDEMRTDETRRDETDSKATYTDSIPASSRATTRASAPKSSGSDARTRASQRRPSSDRSPETSSCTAASQSECSSGCGGLVGPRSPNFATSKSSTGLYRLSRISAMRASHVRRWERDCPLLEPGVLRSGHTVARTGQCVASNVQSGAVPPFLVCVFCTRPPGGAASLGRSWHGGQS